MKYFYFHMDIQLFIIFLVLTTTPFEMCNMSLKPRDTRQHQVKIHRLLEEASRIITGKDQVSQVQLVNL